MEQETTQNEDAAVYLPTLVGGLRLRYATDRDENRLRDLFARSRSDAEQALFALPGIGENVLQMQWSARQTSFQARFPYRITWLVQTESGQTVGSLTVNRSVRDVRLIDIALYPDARNKGAGTHLLRWLQADAARSGQRVHLNVATGSPARRLYERLGFHTVSATQTDTEMVWLPPAH